jgi:hypothetical protein
MVLSIERVFKGAQFQSAAPNSTFAFIGAPERPLRNRSRIDGASLGCEFPDAFWEGVAPHAGELEAVRLVAEPANPPVVKEAFDPAVDLAGVQRVQKLVGLHEGTFRVRASPVWKAA